MSRGGDKLERGLVGFEIDPKGVTAADLGANVGGFTDCLLQHGAARVYAVETGYGVLEWKLRQDDRVVVMERTNALHVELPEPVDLVVADVGWTPLVRYLPRALDLAVEDGRCLALLKPQYEVDKAELVDGHVDPEKVDQVVESVVGQLAEEGCEVMGRCDPELESRGRNPETFLLVRKAVTGGL